MNSLLERIKKASKTQHSDTLSDSKLFESDLVTTDIPMFNVALSGSLNGGLTSGVTCIAGPSKHFKSSYGLLVCSAYLKKHKDSVILFYDSEFSFFFQSKCHAILYHAVSLCDFKNLEQSRKK